MPIQLANPGAPDRYQAALASLTGAASPTDPTMMVSPSSMDPTQQQISDVQQSPVHNLVKSYQQYHAQQQARSSAGGMMANRGMARTPMAQHVQQVRQWPAGQMNSWQHGGSMYVNDGLLQPGQATVGGPVESGTQQGGLTQEQQFQLQRDDTERQNKEADAEKNREAKFQEDNDKQAADYQASLQGTGKYAVQDARLGIEQKKIDASMAKEAGKHPLWSQAGTPAAGPASPAETASPEGQAQAETAKPPVKQTLNLTPTHTLNGRPIAAQGNQWVFADTGEAVQ